MTIRGLVIEKYANPFTDGAIAAGGPAWLIENNQVRYNHGDWHRHRRAATVRGNTVTRICNWA